MLNNPNQEIRTDYQVTDVFKSMAANQLTRSIPYDFVITQNIWDNYISEHPTLDVIDVGSLIACNLDGTDSQTAWAGEMSAPISIYIEAITDKPLDFRDRLYNDSNMLHVTTTEDTANLVNIYSAHPFKLAYLAGGMNVWSTPESVATIVNPSPWQSGIIHIGTCTLLEPYDFGNREGSQIICTSFVDGYRYSIGPTSSQVENGYRPALVMADWMNSTSNRDLGYRIESDDILLPGLWQQIEASYSLGTIPILLEHHTDETYVYKITHITPTTYSFINVELQKKITIGVSGSITRISIGSASNIVELRDSYDAIITLDDETEKVGYSMLSGFDPIASIQELLGNNVAPVIEFSVRVVTNPGDLTPQYYTYESCYAYLCQNDYCGYMFTTYIPNLGHRYICIRYASDAQTTPGSIIATISESDIHIYDGEIAN